MNSMNCRFCNEKQDLIEAEPYEGKLSKSRFLGEGAVVMPLPYRHLKDQSLLTLKSRPEAARRGLWGLPETERCTALGLAEGGVSDTPRRASSFTRRRAPKAGHQTAATLAVASDTVAK